MARYLKKTDEIAIRNKDEISALVKRIEDNFPQISHPVRRKLQYILEMLEFSCERVVELSELIRPENPELTRAVENLQKKIRDELLQRSQAKIDGAKKISQWLFAKKNEHRSATQKEIDEICELLNGPFLNPPLLAQIANTLARKRVALNPAQKEMLVSKITRYAEKRLTPRAVAMLWNALPWLHIRKYPQEFMERTERVAPRMNQQETTMTINALAKLGVQQCPGALFHRICSREIISELDGNPRYRAQTIDDLATFKNIHELIEEGRRQNGHMNVAVFLGECEMKAPLRTRQKIAVEAPPTLFVRTQKTPEAQPAASHNPPLTIDDIHWLRTHPAMQAWKSVRRVAGRVRTGDLSREIEKSGTRVSSLDSFVRMLTALEQENKPLIQSPEVHAFLRRNTVQLTPQPQDF